MNWPVMIGSTYCVVFASICVVCAPLPASAADEDLTVYAVYAVHIDRTPKQSWPGYGVYLGSGYVLTAAHVVGHADETRPRVEFRDLQLPAKPVREGQFEKTDLTLLRVDPRQLPGRWQLRRLPLCANGPVALQVVVVATPEGTARSHILPSRALPPDIRDRFPTAIADVATTGNSGSGVFDAERECLLGIMSRKIQSVVRNGLQTRRIDIGKYFVPVDEIRNFLPAEVQF